MTVKQNKHSRYLLLLFCTVTVFALILTGCGSCRWKPEPIDYSPGSGDDWEVSTPAEQGLDPTLVAKLYSKARKVETLNALLVTKNGYLIAEGYFNGGSVDQETRIQSVTKSYTSALVGIALDQGYLASLDQRMMEFFPELADRIRDPRKNEITIRQMLQMRAGYPWEESSTELFELLYHGFRPSNLVDVPLVRDPGSDFDYSNLSAHLVGVIVARACGTDLKSFAQEHLFGPLGVELVDWITDWEGNYNGHGDMHFTARDMATFGQLYLDEGSYQGEQLIPAEWVRESLEIYSQDAWHYRVGRNWSDNGYGYLWWSVRAGDHRYNLAWGHGGQQIAVVRDLGMVVVVKADPLFGQHGDAPWRREKENLNLVADFIASLPGEH